MSEDKTAPVLAISTAVDRQHVDIDGRAYDLATAEDMTLRDQMWLGRAGKQIKDSMTGSPADAITDEQLGEIEDLMNRVVRMALPSLPNEVFARLRDRHKIALAMAFMSAAGLAGETRQSATPSSPGSSDSMEGAETTGSTSPSPPSDGTSSK